MKLLIRISLLLVFILLLTSCPEKNQDHTQNIEEKEYPVDTTSMNNLLKEIRSLISDKSCNQTSDCALLALGARACGGPNSYDVYAPKNVDSSKLLALSSQLESLEKQYNIDNEVISICMVEPKPAYSCIENQCKKSLHNTQLR